MPTGVPLTYESMLPEISSTHCRIVMPSLQIATNPADIKKAVKSDKRFLKSRLGDFYDRCVRARLRAPGNEKRDQVWTKEGTGLDVLPMELKSKSKKAQYGDYKIEYSINGAPWIDSGLVLERKRYEDFYTTVLFNYETFMKELDRFEDDPDGFDFRIIIEGTVKDVLDHVPVVPAICKCCNFCQPYHNNKKNVHNYNCIFDVLAGKVQKPRLVDPVSTCEFCVPHEKTEKELEDIDNRLRAIIEDFDNQGYKISFYDSREIAMSFVKDIAKRYFVVNYSRLMEEYI